MRVLERNQISGKSLLVLYVRDLLPCPKKYAKRQQKGTAGDVKGMQMNVSTAARLQQHKTAAAAALAPAGCLAVLCVRALKIAAAAEEKAAQAAALQTVAVPLFGVAAAAAKAVAAPAAAATQRGTAAGARRMSARGKNVVRTSLTAATTPAAAAVEVMVQQEKGMEHRNL